MSYFQSFYFSIFSFPEAFFRKTLHFRSSALWNILFPKFSFSIFSFPEAIFLQNAAFPEFCTLERLISKVFIFRFLASQKFFFAKRCISGVLHSGMSYFQSFHFSIFSFPEAFFSQNAAFPGFCTLECLISKVFIFRFLASQKLFFSKRLHFRCSALWNVLFPKFSFFYFLLHRSFFFSTRCISGVLRSGMSYFQSFLFSIFSLP